MSLLNLFPSHTYHTHSLMQRQLLMKKYILVQSTQPLLQICIQQSISNLPKVKFSNCMHTCWRKETPLFLWHTLVPHTSKFEPFLREVFLSTTTSLYSTLKSLCFKKCFLFDHSYQAAAVIIFFSRRSIFSKGLEKNLSR